ncbi:hypothetical protein A1O7_02539 [Cladophialophora yegresii CBS 114405]|uniref:Uncharacterized protein n=1 Tax=Cladophialophora yegresii CBS 114405 TaxID=1182544 RepID=W9WC13_9EURO|nr:uncharacterized protein A1O7_02539 [Cladophialophora yegresii CBS 114405]EXJ62106.1 hypothetical protein A1O7_02539 [Cladophialophora yegresii CBS 114405]
MASTDPLLISAEHVRPSEHTVLAEPDQDEIQPVRQKLTENTANKDTTSELPRQTTEDMDRSDPGPSTSGTTVSVPCQSHEDQSDLEDTVKADSAIREKRPTFRSKLRSRWHAFATAFADGWAFEKASIICSMLLLAALAILYRGFDGKSTTAWSAALSFATVIAIMSKAIQVMLMLPVAASISQMGWMHFYRPRALVDFQRFDAASRGLFGVIALLVTRPSLWTALSATLAITALGIEAAAQQCLQTTAISYLPVLTDIELLDYFATDYESINVGMINAGTAAMTTKIPVVGTNYLLAPSQRVETLLPQKLIYRCQTANCVQPNPYVTLAFCSTCEDVSGALLMNEWCSQPGGDVDEPCGVSMPGGPALYYPSQGIALNATPIAPSTSSHPGPLLLAKFTMVEQIVPFETAGDQPLDFAAQTCSITLCANIYSLDISQGDTGSSGATESLLASFQKATYVEEAQEYDIVVPANSTLRLTHGTTSHWQGGTVTLTIDANSTAFLRHYLFSVFTGTGSLPEYSGLLATNDDFTMTDRLKLASQVAQQPTGTALWDRIVYSLVAYKFENAGDYFFQIDSVVSQVIRSMGNWLRDFYPSEQGKGFKDVQNVNGLANGVSAARIQLPSSYKIQWIWLLIPAAAAILALFQLIIAISLSKSYKVPIWKSNTLAVMHHGYRRRDEFGAKSLQKLSALDHAAGQTQTILASAATDRRLVDLEEAPVEVERWENMSRFQRIRFRCRWN